MLFSPQPSAQSALDPPEAADVLQGMRNGSLAQEAGTDAPRYLGPLRAHAELASEEDEQPADAVVKDEH